MNAYCPECETELDQLAGICPACRWDPIAVAATRRPTAQKEPEMSLTERYRGTRFDVSVHEQTAERPVVSRGRSVVIVALVAGAALYGVVMTTLGPAL